VQGWSSFNAALLHFFLRNPQRCLLVHTQQVRESAASYLQQMRARLDAPWSDPIEQLAGPLALAHDTAVNTGHITHQPPPLTSRLCTPVTQQRPAPDALASFLADALLSQHPASLQLYDDLQACANLPLGDDISEIRPSALEAWRAMAAQLAAAKQNAQVLQAHLNDAQMLAQQRQQLVDEQASLLSTTTQKHQKRLTELSADRDVLEARQREIGEENELLLNQLHQVQQELERHYLEAQTLRQQLRPPAPAKPVFYGARQRVQQQLGYRLGSTMIAHSRSVGGWLRMPFALWGVARQHEQERPERDAKKLPPINKYRDAYDAERVRNHLSYRLGQTLLANLRSPIGWVRLPWAIRREVRSFRTQRQQQS
jgi:hypothetical protein